jgi:hypothetical protein
MLRKRQDLCEVCLAAPPQAANPCVGLDVEGANFLRHKGGECERLELGGRQLISGKDKSFVASCHISAMAFAVVLGLRTCERSS